MDRAADGSTTLAGFVDNFRDKKLHGKVEGENGVVSFDVLGYYEKSEADSANDLPIYAFLAENYGYCDRYFCSHPGLTLPNWMYSLTDVQYDRLSVPIFDNNHGNNFLLSRAPTIYDLLTRKGVSWQAHLCRARHMEFFRSLQTVMKS